MTANLPRSNRSLEDGPACDPTQHAEDDVKTVLDSTTEVTGFIPFGFKLFNLHAPKEQQHFSASVHTHRTRLTSKRKWQVRICYGIGGMLAIAAIVQFAIFPHNHRTNEQRPSSTATQAGQHHPNPILTSPVKNPADAPDKATTSPEIPNNSLQPLHPLHPLHPRP